MQKNYIKIDITQMSMNIGKIMQKKIKVSNHKTSGESPMRDAPSLKVKNDKDCIPQHYLIYNHTRATVEKIICDIDYSERYPIFISEEADQIYIQIGIIGFDNYLPLEKQDIQKLVYGRKWRVEPQLPTSEIIQTVFLALKKAREHEIRELFKVNHHGRITTPLNNHQDLPLFAENSVLLQLNSYELDEEDSLELIKNNLSFIKYDSAIISLNDVQKHSNHKWIIDIELKSMGKFNCLLPELQCLKTHSLKFSFFTNRLTMNEIYFQLMEEFIRISDRHVDENFEYKNFTRFSRNNSVIAISELSSLLRQVKENEKFIQQHLKIQITKQI